METLQSLQNTPVPNLLVIAGLIFLFLAFIGKFGGYIELNEKRQKGAGLLGGGLLVGGIILFLIPPSQLNTNTDTQASSDKSNPEVTYTPTPTNVPRATPTPTATIDADPTVYDNFNNSAFDGSFNQNQWVQWDSPAGSRIAQQNGILVLTRGANPGWAPLGARKYSDFKINNLTIFEAKLMIEDSKPFEYHAFILLSPNNFSSGDYSDCIVRSYGSYNKAEVLCNYFDKGEYISGGSKQVNYGEWHTVRIEVDPTTMMFTYHIDNEVINSYVPSTAEKLKNSLFSFAIGVTGETTEAITGYIDDVRIEQ